MSIYGSIRCELFNELLMGLFRRKNVVCTYLILFFYDFVI